MIVLNSSFFSIAALLCGVGTLAFGFLATYHKDKETKELQRDYQEEITSKTDKIEELNGLVINLQTQGLQELSHQTNLLTGGSTYPVIVFSETGAENSGRFASQLWAVGRYPLHNFAARASVKTPLGTINSEIQGSRIPQYRPMNLDLVVDVSAEIDKAVTIRFFADNGVWIQKTEFRKTDDGKYQTKTVVFPDNQPENLLISADFGEGITMGPLADVFTTQYQNGQ